MPRMPRLRTLVFDLDGTLVDSVPDLAAALNRVLARHGLAAFAEAEVAAMVGDGAAALLARAATARGTSLPRDVLHEFVADYSARTAEVSRAYPGVATTLEILAARGWRLAVCTNKPEAPARALLAALGLARFFAAVGGGDSFATRKPDPGHLLGTLAAAAGTPDRAVMVGDHANDLRAAAAAGIPAIFAGWGYGPADGAAIPAVTPAGIPARAAALLPR